MEGTVRSGSDFDIVLFVRGVRAEWESGNVARQWRENLSRHVDGLQRRLPQFPLPSIARQARADPASANGAERPPGLKDVGVRATGNARSGGAQGGGAEGNDSRGDEDGAETRRNTTGAPTGTIAQAGQARSSKAGGASARKWGRETVKQRMERWRREREMMMMRAAEEERRKEEGEGEGEGEGPREVAVEELYVARSRHYTPNVLTFGYVSPRTPYPMSPSREQQALHAQCTPNAAILPARVYPPTVPHASPLSHTTTPHCSSSLLHHLPPFATHCPYAPQSLSHAIDGVLGAALCGRCSPLPLYPCLFWDISYSFKEWTEYWALLSTGELYLGLPHGDPRHFDFHHDRRTNPHRFVPLSHSHGPAHEFDYVGCQVALAPGQQEVRVGGGDVVFKRVQPCEAEEGCRLEGRFVHAAARDFVDAAEASGVHGGTTVTFRGDGTFSVQGATGILPCKAGGVSVGEGAGTGMGAGRGVGSEGREQEVDDEEREGRGEYEIRGKGIELRYEGGRVEDAFFFEYPGSGGGEVNINGTTYHRVVEQGGEQ
ncbi:unnamed protein product [Closterium sp. Naga37s-1]|nr:unnamed protein product [Closterium sp. Naga37s-1]